LASPERKACGLNLDWLVKLFLITYIHIGCTLSLPRMHSYSSRSEEYTKVYVDSLLFLLHLLHREHLLLHHGEHLLHARMRSAASIATNCSNGRRRCVKSRTSEACPPKPPLLRPLVSKSSGDLASYARRELLAFDLPIRGKEEGK
jgi:hypothetical protein